MRPAFVPLLIATTVAASCDVVHPEPRPGLGGQLVLFAILNPDSTRQAVAVASTDQVDPALSGVTVRMHKRAPDSAGSDWAFVAEATDTFPRAQELFENNYPCFSDKAISHWQYCLALPVVVEPGATYKIEATADGHPTASGTTRVVGNFEIDRTELSGNVLSASWTPSLAAHRYLMGVVYWDTNWCCSPGWSADLPGTSFNAAIPREAIDSAGPVPTLVVSAVDRHYHAYLTTGHAGQLFKVPPVQNVEGGFGMVGSAQHASRPIAIRP